MNEKARIMAALGARQCERCRELLDGGNQRWCDACAGSPSSVMDDLIARAAWETSNRLRPGAPGELVMQLTPERRRALEGLTADDVSDVRMDLWCGRDPR